jgi:hypothetical protein
MDGMEQFTSTKLDQTSMNVEHMQARSLSQKFRKENFFVISAKKGILKTSLATNVLNATWISV